jgi:hypothetical protein
MEDKIVSILLKNDIFYLQAYSRTVDGIWSSIHNDVHTLKRENMDKLGEILLKTLDESLVGIPPITVFGIQKILSATGEKSEKMLIKKSKAVSIDVRDGKIFIAPEKFDGKYMKREMEKEIESSLDPERLTQDVLKAFELEKV